MFSENYRKIADEYDGDRFLMGEVDGDKGRAMEVSKTFTDTGRLHATYNFDLLAWGGLSVDGLRDAINKAVDTFNGSGRLCFAFSNHDVPRSATRQLAALGLSPDQSDAMQLLLLKLETCLIGSSCVYQGEELGLEDVTDIPVEEMQDPWGVKFAPAFLGRDTCRTPMVWENSNQHGGFSTATSTWLPVSSKHLKRAGLDMAQTDGSIYQQFAHFLAWRKHQPAIMNSNTMSAVKGDDRTLVFDRISNAQTLRCTFDFDTLTASFEEI
jgi:alpha-glucosidase